MSEFVKKIKDGTIPIKVSNIPYRNKYHKYGSIKKLDQLVDSPDINDRIKAVQMAYGLEKLMDDPSPEVRIALIELIKPDKYGSIKKFDQLVDSPDINDRIKAVQMAYGLEKLMDDPTPEVQEALLELIKPEE